MSQFQLAWRGHRPMTRSITACSLALIAATAFGADGQGNYGVWGVGQASCNQFSKADAKGDVQDYKAFLAGYLTAYNTVVDGVYQATGKQTMADNLAALTRHCGANPMESVERAIQAVIAEAAQQQRETKSTAAWGRATPAQ